MIVILLWVGRDKEISEVEIYIKLKDYEIQVLYPYSATHYFTWKTFCIYGTLLHTFE
jgi:hypothetical protein